jgi:hypothetical protein
MARRGIEPSTTAVQRSNRAESRTGFLKLRTGKPEKQAISCGQLSASFQLAFNPTGNSAAGTGAGVPCGYPLVAWQRISLYKYASRSAFEGRQ